MKTTLLSYRKWLTVWLTLSTRWHKFIFEQVEVCSCAESCPQGVSGYLHHLQPLQGSAKGVPLHLSDYKYHQEQAVTLLSHCKLWKHTYTELGKVFSLALVKYQPLLPHAYSHAPSSPLRARLKRYFHNRWSVGNIKAGCEWQTNTSLTNAQ